MISQNQSIPRISVVCPVYNGAVFIIKTLESVVDQSVKPHELIVVDDGSTDDTQALVIEFSQKNKNIHIQFIKNLHRGPGAARNSGIIASTGEWIAFLDSDDDWRPNKLEQVSKIIEHNSNVNFICHAEEHIYIDGNREIADYSLLYNPHDKLTKQLYKLNLFSTSAVTCKKQLLIEHGLFDETLMSSQDYDLWLKLSPHINPFFIKESLGSYVYRKGNITSNNRLRRWKNLLIIASRYRHYVGMKGYIYKCLRLSASMMLQAVR